MTSLGPELAPTLNHRTPSPANAARPLYVSLQQQQQQQQNGGWEAAPSGPTTPHGHPLPSYNRFGPGPGPASQRKTTVVPYLKLLPLCIARISEGMIYSVIFPYINEMILSFGVNENDVGVWSAIAVSPRIFPEADVTYPDALVGISPHGD